MQLQESEKRRSLGAFPSQERKARFRAIETSSQRESLLSSIGSKLRKTLN